jgi:membrane-bound ClpP family serine protease
MGLDIKLPIGLMFAIFGVILTILGLATNGNEMYSISLNANINLFSGLFMLVFAAFMLIAAYITRKKSKEEAK